MRRRRTLQIANLLLLASAVVLSLFSNGCVGSDNQGPKEIVSIDGGTDRNENDAGKTFDGRGGFQSHRADPDDADSPETADAGTDWTDSSSGGCPAGETSCSGSCVDLSSSDRHCGACGNACPSNASCSGESCSCDDGGTICGGQCVDTSSSDAHCGSCGNSCGDARSCEGGSCTCPSGQDYCDGSCTDTTSNTDHCGSCGNSCAGGEICSSGTCGPSERVANVISETNDVRSTSTDCGQYGTLSSAPPMKGNANLHQAAQKHAEDMTNNDFFGHTGSDGSTFDERIRNAGFNGQPVAENVAAGQSTAAATVEQWKNSDGHCRNMMLDQANRIGVGFARGGTYRYYWVQVFGRK